LKIVENLRANASTVFLMSPSKHGKFLAIDHFKKLELVETVGLERFRFTSNGSDAQFALR